MSALTFRHCCRAFLAVHSTSFLCEAALVTVTLLKLVVEARDPRFDSSDAEAARTFRINTAVTAVSFAFTAIAFVGTVSGMGALIARLRNVARRISHRVLPLTPKAASQRASDAQRPGGSPAPAGATTHREQPPDPQAHAVHVPPVVTSQQGFQAASAAFAAPDSPPAYRSPRAEDESIPRRV